MDMARKVGLHKLYRVIEEFRKLDPEIPSQTINTFLYVALNEGVSNREIGHALNMPQSSTSRNIALMSKLTRHGKAGFGLLQSDIDPLERRRRIIRLTPKGHRFLEDIDFIMER